MLSSSTLSLSDGAIWRADALAQSSGTVVATGHAALDAQLPGGGWPVGALVEVLQPAGLHCEWQLLLPALMQRQKAEPSGAQRQLVLVGAPFMPFGPGLAGRGLLPQQVLCVQAGTALERLWAAEQALHCTAVAAVLLWLPQVRAEHLRRLHAAAASHQTLLFVMRPAQAQDQSSPAVLRLALQAGSDDKPHLQGLKLIKRRGPPLQELLHIPAAPARLSALMACPVAEKPPHRAVFPSDDGHLPVTTTGHALDRLAVQR